MRRRAKKPKILSDKIKLAELIKNNWEQLEYNQHPSVFRRFWWSGEYRHPNGKNIIRIFVQMYVRRPGVDYVNMHWINDGRHDVLTVKEIKELLK